VSAIGTRGWRAGTAVTRTIVSLCAIGMVWGVQGCAVPQTGGFATVTAPFGASVDVITGLPSCGVNLPGIGPVGMLDDGTSFYVTDWCNATTYRFLIGDTPPWSLAASAPNGFTHGLTYDRGAYYGIAGSHQSTVVPGVYQFDPDTLRPVRLIVPGPCSDTRGLVADRTTGELFVTGDCGLWRIRDAGTPTPAMARIALSNLDGLTLAGDGGMWAADVVTGHITRYGSTGAVATSVAIADPPSGVAVAPSSAPATVAGKVFVNSVDGVVTMVDTHSRNAASPVAWGGTRGDFAIFGRDGYLYATQADRIVRLTYPTDATARVSPPAARVAYPLVFACALLALTVVLLLLRWRWRATHRRTVAVRPTDIDQPRRTRGQ
jgi:hypothetical protein